MTAEARRRAGSAGASPRHWLHDPVLAVSAGFAGLCLLLVLAALVSPGARAFYEAGFAAMYDAMAGMAAACQWTY